MFPKIFQSEKSRFSSLEVGESTKILEEEKPRWRVGFLFLGSPKVAAEDFFKASFNIKLHVYMYTV